MSEAEISQFDQYFVAISNIRDKHIFRFEVPVHNPVLMQTAQRHQQLLDNVNDQQFREAAPLSHQL